MKQPVTELDYPSKRSPLVSAAVGLRPRPSTSLPFASQDAGRPIAIPTAVPTRPMRGFCQAWCGPSAAITIQ